MVGKNLDLDLRRNLYLSDTGRRSGDDDDFILHVLAVEGVVEPLAGIDEAQSRPSEGQHHHARRRDHPIHERVQQVHLLLTLQPETNQMLRLGQPGEGTDDRANPGLAHFCI